MGAQVNGLYEKEFSQQEGMTSLKTVQQVGRGELRVSLLLLSLCQTPLGKEPRRLFCDDNSDQSILCLCVF